jgi:hypothetical protein
LRSPWCRRKSRSPTKRKNSAGASPGVATRGGCDDATWQRLRLRKGNGCGDEGCEAARDPTRQAGLLQVDLTAIPRRRNKECLCLESEIAVAGLDATPPRDVNRTRAAGGRPMTTTLPPPIERERSGRLNRPLVRSSGAAPVDGVWPPKAVVIDWSPFARPDSTTSWTEILRGRPIRRIAPSR